ncbi:hypothetical protein EVAR_99391_1 [Eumeta japonica]|uniref:Uncharacterized protein n=1 Tax=Eumeta variegata TaxID=151549 RepID=A0A4C2AB52_EUMVA|nr:hypothetical protein EVAR_99391_1 [Eumeta japonica]
MADIAAVRREARRKKILENSSNRLQLISGKNNDECLKGTGRPSVLDDIHEVSRCESPAAAFNGSAIMETFHPFNSFSNEIEETEIANDPNRIVSKMRRYFRSKCLRTLRLPHDTPKRGNNRSAGKIMGSIFWDIKGWTEYLGRGAIVTGSLYAE